MHEVIRRVASDAEIDLDFDECSRELSTEEKKLLKKIKSAKLVNGLIDRGVVKRTVMTSVYGVTFIGARNQIEEKINEKRKCRRFKCANPSYTAVTPLLHTRTIETVQSSTRVMILTKLQRISTSPAGIWQV